MPALGGRVLTDLAFDLRVTDATLIASYARQWERFEQERWWPWYEKWGQQFFAPTGSAETIPLKSPDSKPKGKLKQSADSYAEHK